MIVDYQREVYSLPRLLNLKTKDVRVRLGEGGDLLSVEEARKHIAERMAPTIRRHIAEARRQFKERTADLEQRRIAMAIAHRQARRALDERQTVEWQAETIARAVRLPKGLRAIWQRITGQYQRLRAQNEREAEGALRQHAQEREALFRMQLLQRGGLQEKIGQLRRAQASRLTELRKDGSEHNPGFLRSGEANTRVPLRKSRRGPE